MHVASRFCVHPVATTVDFCTVYSNAIRRQPVLTFPACFCFLLPLLRVGNPLPNPRFLSRRRGSLHLPLDPSFRGSRNREADGRAAAEAAQTAKAGPQHVTEHLVANPSRVLLDAMSAMSLPAHWSRT